MAFGLGGLTLVVAVMCTWLLVIIGDVSTLVASMKRDETPIRQSLALATAVREQYIHIAHSLIERDTTHLDHYDVWRRRVVSGLEQLAGSVPQDERWRLDDLSEKTARLHDHFIERALPAATRNDADVRPFHHELEPLAIEAAAQADALTQVFSSRMARAHAVATDAALKGLVGGGACMLLVVVLSVAFTIRLRSAVFRPLRVLTTTVRRLGRGDLDARVGPVGEGELGDLASAFDWMAQELSDRQRRLLQSERMAAIGSLAAGVAHELNNPIGIIRGYLKTMDPSTSSTDALREELGILDEEAQHCQRIAEDLLAYARAREPVRENLQMQAFVEEALNRFQTGLHKAVTIETDTAPCRLRADPTGLRQILMNLLANATQASPPSKPVKVRGKIADGEYTIAVCDAGPGVSPDDRDRVFEPFYTKRRGGSGLGLSVCLGIARAHGGRIEISDSEDGGACFTLHLPLTGDAPGASAPSPTAANVDTEENG
jgi:signal transduction histidine kinase